MASQSIADDVTLQLRDPPIAKNDVMSILVMAIFAVDQEKCMLFVNKFETFEDFQ